MKKIDVLQEAYFPFTFKLFGVVLVIFGILIWTQPIPEAWKPIITIVSWVVAALISTTRYGLWVDPIDKSYCMYIWILGIKNGSPEPYDSIRKIFINEVTDSAHVQTRAGSSFMAKKQLYKAFIKLDNDDKIHLDTDKKLDRLETRVAEYNKSLGIGLEAASSQRDY